METAEDVNKPSPSESQLNDNSNMEITTEDSDKASSTSSFSPEEDPGPGTVGVKVAGSETVDLMDKRVLASHSLYFRSCLLRFLGTSTVVELSRELVTPEAWQIIKQFLITSQLRLGEDYRLTTQVLQAVNYLQMEQVQDQTAEILKKLVNKTNFITLYDFSVLRGIGSLSSYIYYTVIKPEESIRRRKYGQFDLSVKLGQLSLKCHRVVLCRMSPKLAELFSGGDKEVEGGHKREVKEVNLGLEHKNLQKFYNVLDLAYLGKEVRELNGLFDRSHRDLFP